ncbi:MAG: hypothetical protein ACREFP_16630 [Acetobacteraceae bacterium]
MLDGQVGGSPRLPIVWSSFGRQRVGKTVLLTMAGQYFRGLGNPIRIWNADQQNRSHTLSLFFDDAEEVPAGGIEDGKLWIEGRLGHLIEHGYDAVLDVGGGATGFAKLLQEVPLLETLEGSGVRLVALFCIGPERADLDYLEEFADGGLFLPAASVIVLNAGLVLSGRSVMGAFGQVLQHRVVKATVERGTKVAVLPALTCMAEVTDRGLTFEQAMNGAVGIGERPLSLFDRARVNRWWSRDIPKFFAGLPAEWLPMPREINSAGVVQPAAGEAG